MPRFFKPQKKPARQKVQIDELLHIESLSDDGRGVARFKGKTVFVDNALAGEAVKVRVLAQTSRFIEARAIAIDEPSAQRIEPACAHAEACGGCSVQHLAYEAQYQHKAQRLIAQLQHHAHTPKILDSLHDKGFGYRNRTRLGVSVNKSGEVTLGFRAKQSRQLVNITQCPVMLPALSELIQPLHEWLKTLGNAAVTHIELVGHKANCGAIIRHTRSIPQALKRALKVSLEHFHCQTWFQSNKQGSLEDEEGNPVDPRLSYCLSSSLSSQELHFNYHPQDFIQANPVVNAKMVEQALSLLKPEAYENFADFFCGIGNFSLPLAKVAASVQGFEGVQAMVERASANAQLNKLSNAHFSQADLGEEDASVYHIAPIDGLVLDPPRSGAKSICTHIKRLDPKRIVYVSCNPATFTRDAQLLCANGYDLAASGLMDMFPQTSHSEVIGLFKK